MAPLQFLALLVLGAGISGIPGILGIPEGESPEEAPAPVWLQPRSPGSPPAPSWLLWAPFRGRVPPGAVSSRSGRSGRAQFVCSVRGGSHGCALGSFEPERGPFCAYGWDGRELRGRSFHLLLNPGAFEALHWADAAFGSAPEGAVEGCPLTDMFVGRSPDGLGKASKEQQALFVPVDGEELWYKWYQVLVARPGPADVTIANVSYNGSAARESARSAELAELLLRNEGCAAATRTVTLEEDTEVEHGWSAELPALAAAHGLLRAAPLVFTQQGGWESGKVAALPWAGGASAGEFVSRRHRLRQEIPARSECAAVLRGLQREMRVPFQAWLTREFRSGHRHRVPVTGWAQTRAVTDVRAGLERCRRLSELPPCPS